MRVNLRLVVLALLCGATAVALASDKPVDLTGADADKFRSQVGHTVILRGRLEEGKEGATLLGATPNNVVFYVVPEMPPSGIYSYPATWERLLHRQVQLTGELKFRSFDRSKTRPYVQVPSDYFYMVLQRTRIDRSGSK
jgi:hypothetical protein